MKKIIKRFQVSKRMKNVAKLSSGTLGGQIISIITVPIFTRLYGAEVLGVWAFLNSISLFVNAFSDLGLTNAIMTADIETREDERIYKVVSSVGVIVSLLISTMISLFYTITNSNDTGLNIVFLFFYIFFAIFTLQQTQICYTWLNKDENYSVLMKNPLINNLAFSIVGISLGFLGFQQYGYYLGWLIGQILTLVHMKKYLPNMLFTFKIKDYQSVFKENLHFIKFQMPTNILVQFKTQLPAFLIKNLFGATLLGYYSISVKILNIPINLLGNAIGRVFFQEASKMYRKDEKIGNFVYESMATMMKWAIVPMILLISFGDYATVLFLGQDWRVAGDILIIVAFQAYFRFLSASVQGINIIIKKQNYQMIMNFAQIIVIFLSFYIAKFIFNNIFIGLLMMSVLFGFSIVVFFTFLFKEIGISRKKYLRDISLNLSFIMLVSFIVKSIMYIVTN